MFAFLFKLFLVSAVLAGAWFAGKYIGLFGRRLNGVDAAPQEDSTGEPRGNE